MKAILLISHFLIVFSTSEAMANNDLGLPIGFSKEHLNVIKQRIQEGDQSFNEHLRNLYNAADSLLIIKPPTVMDDSIAPRGLSPHDYVSYAPYWWPNPNTESGLPYIRKDGVINLEIRNKGDDKNFTRMANSAHLLSIAYFYSEEEKYAQKAVDFIYSWFLDSATYMTPHVQGGQIIMGRKNYGRRAGINELRFLSNVIDALSLIENSPSWTEEKKNNMHEWFKEYLNWLKESEHGKKELVRPNNHGTWYDVQYVSISIYLGQLQGAAEHIKKYTYERISQQIMQDGEQPLEVERGRSLHYSLYNIRAYLALSAYAERLDIDLWNYHSENGASIKSALDFLLPFCGNQSKWPYPDLGKLEPKKWGLLLAQAIYKCNEVSYRNHFGKLNNDPCYPNCYFKLIVPPAVN